MRKIMKNYSHAGWLCYIGFFCMVSVAFGQDDGVNIEIVRKLKLRDAYQFNTPHGIKVKNIGNSDFSGSVEMHVAGYTGYPNHPDNNVNASLIYGSSIAYKGGKTSWDYIMNNSCIYPISDQFWCLVGSRQIIYNSEDYKDRLLQVAKWSAPWYLAAAPEFDVRIVLYLGSPTQLTDIYSIKLPGLGEILPDFILQDRLNFLKEPENFPDNSVMLNTHRGVWMDNSENSRSAYQAAIDNSFGMIEVDVQRSKDDTLFMIHDFELSRLTNSNITTDNNKSRLFTTNTAQIPAPFTDFKYLMDLPGDRPWSELKNLKLRDRRGQVMEEGLIRFAEVLDICKGKILLDVDKVDKYFTKVWPMIKARGMQGQVIFKGSSAFWTPQRIVDTFGVDDAKQVMFSPQYFYNTKPIVNGVEASPTNANFKANIDMWLQADRDGILQVHSFQFFPELMENDPLLFPINLAKYIRNDAGHTNIINERKHVWQAEMPVDVFNGQSSSNNRIIDQDEKTRKKMTVDQVLESDATIIDTDRPLLRRQYLKKKGYKVH